MSDDGNDERRRSEETQQAITYQLEYLVETFETLELMVLADDQGVMFAYAGDEEAAEVFAIQTALIADGAPPDSELLELIPNVRRDKILCEPINLDDIPLYLGAVMEPTAENAKAYQRARTGIQRIYYTTSELAGDQD